MSGIVTSVLDRPRLIGLLLALASAAMLGGAFYFQHVEGLAPCPLCIAQRWAHAVVLVIGLILALGVGGKRLGRPWLAALTLALLGSAGIAAYHVGVELHWIESAFCGVSDGANTIEDLKAQLWETDVVRCDEVPWSLFGISMAGYNLLISLVLAAVALFATVRPRPKGDVWQAQPNQNA
ncbi:MAG: disulfide bond formation protein B [Pseudomonadota bacterium]